MRAIFYTLIVALVAFDMQRVSSLSCRRPCFCNKKGIVCCKSGELAKDACWCCDVCAKDDDDKCGGIFGTSGRCKHGHFCYRSCVKNPKYAGDRCSEDFLSNIEGRCVSAAEKEELEQDYGPLHSVTVKRFDKGTPKLRRVRECQGELGHTTWFPTLTFWTPPPPPPPPKKMYLLVNVPDM